MVDYAAGIIRRGHVVGVPTDTFYALSADPFNLAAIEEVFRIKGRPETRALPILVSSIEQSVTLVRDIPDAYLVLANKFWPGALTLVVEATHRLPLKVTGNTGRVALRWPDSCIATALIESTGGPIPQNAEYVFRNLPLVKMQLDYDTKNWDARLVPVDGETQKLIVKNKGSGPQKRCVVHWKVVP